MKFTFAAALVLGIIALAAIAEAKPADKIIAEASDGGTNEEVKDKGTDKNAEAANFCDKKVAKTYYKDEKSGKGFFGAWNCMKYHECVDGKDTVHHCSWIIPLRQYDPKTQECKWFWSAHCKEDDPSDDQGTDKGSDKGQDSNAHKLVVNGTDKGTDQGSEKETDKGADQGTDKEADKGTDKGNDKGNDKGTDLDSDKGSDKGTDKGDDKGSDKGSDKGTDEGDDKGADKGSDKGSDKVSDKDSDKGSDKGSDKESDKDSDKGSDKGSDKESDKDTDKGSDKGDDKGTDKDSDKGSDKGDDKGSDKGTDKGSDKGTDEGSENPTNFCDKKVAKTYYKDEKSGKGFFGAWNCMKYHECVDGKDTVHHCSWIIPLRQYDPKTQECKWFWSAHCKEDDPTEDKTTSTDSKKIVSTKV